MIFYKKYNFAFQHINRTGGSSVKRAIRTLVGKSDEGSNPLINAHRTMASRLDRIRLLHPEIDIDNLSMYTNVRSPFARIVSIYSTRKRRDVYLGRSFKWFFYNVYMRSTTIPNAAIDRFILNRKGKAPRNLTIVRFEEIKRVWPDIIYRHFGKRIDKFPHVTPSDHDIPMSYFDKDMIKKVLRKEDWVVRNYYPRLRGLI